MVWYGTILAGQLATLQSNQEWVERLLANFLVLLHVRGELKYGSVHDPADAILTMG